MAVFTTWAAMRIAVKDALADYIANGAIESKSYEINGKSRVFRSIKEFNDLLDLIDAQEYRESAGTAASCTSYLSTSGWSE